MIVSEGGTCKRFSYYFCRRPSIHHSFKVYGSLSWRIQIYICLLCPIRNNKLWGLCCVSDRIEVGDDVPFIITLKFGQMVSECVLFGKSDVTATILNGGLRRYLYSYIPILYCCCHTGRESNPRSSPLTTSTLLIIIPQSV